MVHFISFPKLFDWTLEINPVAFRLFGWPIRWYGVILTAAFVLGGLYAMRRAKRFETDGDTVIDLLIIALPCAVLGARAYYVLHSWDYYSSHLNELFSIWKGGLAIYGGVIAGILVVLFFGRRNRSRFNILSFLDLGSLGLLLGQAIGRWGNFVNGEAFGGPTSLPWGMSISQSVQPVSILVHPAFLYESLWNLTGFVLLHFYSRHRKCRGDLFAWYCVWYGLGRGVIEGLRTDSLYIVGTNIRVSQVVAFVGFAVGALFLAYLYLTRRYQTTPALNLDCPSAQTAEGAAEAKAQEAPAQEEDARPERPPEE